jgi:hypothetical protein
MVVTAPSGGGGSGDEAAVQYAVELYLPRFGKDALPAANDRAGAAAEQMAREGTPVRFLRSIFVPGDEVCFLLFEGPCTEAVAAVAQRASIEFERVLEVNVAFDNRKELL